MKKPLIAVIGRPNVGKSTLFNRITRKRDAIVDNCPGITRDRHYGDVVWDDRIFTLIDTGGYIINDEDHFADKIRSQVQQAIMDADAVVVMLDGKYGLSPFDGDLIGLLRNHPKPVIYIVNKIDSSEHENRIFEFYQLGIEPIIPISAEHGYGISDFMEVLLGLFPETAEANEDDRDEIKVAIVGKPNVGKSSLVNRIIGEERLLVSDQPGTTRDAIDIRYQYYGKTYRLIDTAGIRRKSRVTEKIEKISIIKALKSIDECDVSLIVLDAAEGITEQDITIAGHAYERGCGCILLLNKWDLIDKSTLTERAFVARLKEEARFLNFAPTLTLSALTGQRVSRIFKLVDEVFSQYSTRINTGVLNRIMEQAVHDNPPSLYKGKRLKFYYTTQASTKPPTFISFVNYPDAVHFSYKRFISNRIRDGAQLDKTPIRLLFRQRTGRIKFPGKQSAKWKTTKKAQKLLKN